MAPSLRLCKMLLGRATLQVPLLRKALTEGRASKWHKERGVSGIFCLKCQSGWPWIQLTRGRVSFVPSPQATKWVSLHGYSRILPAVLHCNKMPSCKLHARFQFGRLCSVS
ncbi:Hypothetical predicted protein [Podarcis lilfordi]|uniref:Uncharacterized protein n=1 Tax=Podarcis lilfordi TaxID=74358 RepID=A0AA35JVY6_9SAUR|nr:Hypothetical predicted protein [Podarcis lilfordi]